MKKEIDDKVYVGNIHCRFSEKKAARQDRICTLVVIFIAIIRRT